MLYSILAHSHCTYGVQYNRMHDFRLFQTADENPTAHPTEQHTLVILSCAHFPCKTLCMYGVHFTAHWVANVKTNTQKTRQDKAPSSLALPRPYYSPTHTHKEPLWYSLELNSWSMLTFLRCTRVEQSLIGVMLYSDVVRETLPGRAYCTTSCLGYSALSSCCVTEIMMAVKVTKQPIFHMLTGFVGLFVCLACCVHPRNRRSSFEINLSVGMLCHL